MHNLQLEVKKLILRQTSPTVLPAERSVPSVKSIPPTPRAIIIREEDWLNILIKFFNDKNLVK